MLSILTLICRPRGAANSRSGGKCVTESESAVSEVDSDMPVTGEVRGRGPRGDVGSALGSELET